MLLRVSRELRTEVSIEASPGKGIERDRKGVSRLSLENMGGGGGKTDRVTARSFHLAARLPRRSTMGMDVERNEIFVEEN